MMRVLIIVLMLLLVVGCPPKEKPLPPLLPETAATFESEGVPEDVQKSFRKDYPSAKVDKVFKEIVAGDLHYFIKYTDPKTGRKGDAEYDEKGEKALPKAQRSS
jgi:hypothetical protein